MSQTAVNAAAQKKRAESAYLIGEVEWMQSNGATPWEVCAALGKQMKTLSRLLYRNGRGDLAAAFDAVLSQDRRAG